MQDSGGTHLVINAYGTLPQTIESILWGAFGSGYGTAGSALMLF